MTETRRL